MDRLLKIRPIFLFPIFIVYMILVGFIVSYIDKTIDLKETWFFVIFVFGFLIYYFFWIYILGYGFNKLDSNNVKLINLERFRLVIILTVIVYLIGMIVQLDLLFKLKTELTDIISIIMGLTIFASLIYIVKSLTKNFRFHDQKTEARLFDYIVNLFLLSFFPFGLIIMHSHLQMILKDKNVFEGKER